MQGLELLMVTNVVDRQLGVIGEKEVRGLLPLAHPLREGQMTVASRRALEALAVKEDDIEDRSGFVDDAADVRLPRLVEGHREQQPGALIDDGPMHEVQTSQEL